MADKKISALTASTTPLAGTEVLPIVQGGSTVKVSVANLTAGRAVAASTLSTTGDIYVGTTGGAFAEKLRVFGNYAVLDNGTYTGFVGAGASIGAGGATDFSLRSQAGMAFAVGGTTLALQFSAAANVTVNTGNLVIGTAGKGIDFSANPAAPGMTSELLADYEEGTFTPSFTSTGLTVAYGQQTGMYTKVGRLVTASVYILVNSASGTLTNALYISGLPFTTPGGVEYGFSAVFGVYQFTGVTPAGFMGALDTRIQLYQAGTVTPLTGAALAAGYYLATITYSASS